MPHHKKNEEAVEPQESVETAPVEIPFEPKRTPQLGDAVIYGCTYLPASYAATIAAVRPDGSFDLVVFDTTQNPPLVLRRGIREGNSTGTFQQRD